MTFPGFVDEFTNSPVQPAFSTYLQLALTGNVTLEWPTFAVNATNPFSQLVQVVSNTSAGNTISLPDATLSSIQNTILFANPTGTAYNVTDFEGGAVATVPAGQVYFVALTDNSTQAGSWFKTLFGGTASPADAAALVGAGYGLIAQSGLIKVNDTVTVINGTSVPIPYTVSNADRGHLLVWTAGTGVLNLPSAVGTGITNGFIFAVTNPSLAGLITVVPNGTDKIDDNLSTFSITPHDSCYFICDGASKWYSLGFGQDNPNNVDQITINMTATPISISNTDAAAIIQKYVDGVVTNVSVTASYPKIKNEYIIWNANTDVTKTVTVKILDSTQTIIVSSGEIISVFSDGTDMYPSTNRFLGADGTNAQPSFSFLSSEGTGFYKSADGVGLAINGSQTVDFIIDQIQSDEGNATAPGYSFLSNPDTGMYYDLINLALAVSDGGDPSARFKGSQIFAIDKTTALLPAYSFFATDGSSDSGWGMYADTSDSLGIATDGQEAINIDANGFVTFTRQPVVTFKDLAVSVMTTAGDMLYNNAGNINRLPKGTTANQPLIMNAAGTAPTYAGVSIASPLTIKTDRTIPAPYTAAAWTTIAGLVTPSKTPSATNSIFKVTISANLLCVDSATGLQVGSGAMKLQRKIGVGAFADVGVGAGGAPGEASVASLGGSVNFVFYDTNPLTLAGYIYQVQVYCIAGSSIYYNANAVGGFSGYSSITIEEIGGN